ncbi:Profilin [Artemisia annua]|uniref:Profilin n=1 Tax=Artemisia annua TaxID=35608 RepID=A0A2U1MU64_ARTAN|nr:Profilin [Artemisia annua]
MDWAFVNRTWEKWASNTVGSDGHPLKAALLINYDPTGPSRLLSTIAEEEGIEADPIEVSQFVNFVKRCNYQSESFFLLSSLILLVSATNVTYIGFSSSKVLLEVAESEGR